MGLEVSKKTVKNNVVSGSSGSGDQMLWELRGEMVKQEKFLFTCK